MKSQKLFRPLLALAALLAAALACQIGGPPAIGEVVVAQSLDSDYKPVNPTSSYTTDDQVISVSVEVQNIEVGNVVEVKFKLNGQDYDTINTTANEAGSGYYGFTLTHPEGHSPGDYSAEVYLNGQLAKTVTFKIVPSGPPSVASAVAAKAVDENNKPVSPTSVFPPSDTIHISARVRNLIAGSEVTVKYYFEGEHVEALDTTLTSESAGSGYYDFTVAPPTDGFPVGSYKAEVYLDGTLVNTVEFSVQ